MSAPDDLVELGRVLGPHGIQGWIKIQPFSSDSTVLGSAKKWWLNSPIDPLQVGRGERSAEPVSLSVVWAKPHGNFWLARVKESQDRDTAQSLKGKTISVSRAAFPELAQDEYYWVDLVGCDVSTDADGDLTHLGVVESVQDSPAHPILMVRQQVQSPEGSHIDRLSDNQKPVYSLIPFVSAHVLSVDTASRVIATNWPRDF